MLNHHEECSDFSSVSISFFKLLCNYFKRLELFGSNWSISGHSLQINYLWNQTFNKHHLLSSLCSVSCLIEWIWTCFAVLLFYYLLIKTVLLDYPFVMRLVLAVAHYRITSPKGKVLLRFFSLAFSFSPDGYPCCPAPLNGAGRPLPQEPHKRLHRTGKSHHLRGPLAVCFLSNQPQRVVPF